MDYGSEKIITNMCAPMFGNHRKRCRKFRGSSDAVKKINQAHKVDTVEGILKMNFQPGDWHLALTYSDENVGDEIKVRKDRRNFFAKLKRRCEKIGLEMKYISTVEQGVRSSKWHIHVVLPQKIPITTIFECWQFGQVRILNVLYRDGNFRGLAKYLVDRTKGGEIEDTSPAYSKSFSCSRNCVKPVITYETNLGESWRKTPRPPKGWAIKPDSIYNSSDGWGGYPYQKYVLVKIE